MSDKPKNLTDFIASKLGAPEQPEPAGVVAARERNDSLKERAEKLAQWRAYNREQHPKVPDNLATGANFKEVRERCGLSIGDVGEVTGTSPNSVVDYEQGRDSFASAAYKRLLGSMGAAIRAGQA